MHLPAMHLAHLTILTPSSKILSSTGLQQLHNLNAQLLALLDALT